MKPTPRDQALCQILGGDAQAKIEIRRGRRAGGGRGA